MTISGEQPMTSTIQSVGSVPPTRGEIQKWLVAHLADLLFLDPDEIDIQTPLTGYGIDSMQVAILMGDLERWLEVHLDDSLIFDYPSTDALSRHLATLVQERQPSSTAVEIKPE